MAPLPHPIPPHSAPTPLPLRPLFYLHFLVLSSHHPPPLLLLLSPVTRKIHDITLKAANLVAQNEMLIRNMCACTGMTDAELRPLFNRDRYLSAREALEMGIIDSVINRFPPAVSPPRANDT